MGFYMDAKTAGGLFSFKGADMWNGFNALMSFAGQFSSGSGLATVHQKQQEETGKGEQIPSNISDQSSANEHQTNPTSTSTAGTSAAKVTKLDAKDDFPGMGAFVTRKAFQNSFFGLEITMPINYIEDLRTKISKHIPSFIESYAGAANAWFEAHKWDTVASYVKPDNSLTLIHTANVVTIVALFILENFYYNAMGLYLMFIESLKLGVQDNYKQAAFTFVLGATTCYFSFLLSCFAAVGMINNYYAACALASKNVEALITSQPQQQNIDK